MYHCIVKPRFLRLKSTVHGVKEYQFVRLFSVTFFQRPLSDGNIGSYKFFIFEFTDTPSHREQLISVTETEVLLYSGAR